MRNVLRGGLGSLIPHREVEDADEVLGRLDDELRVDKGSKKKQVNVVADVVETSGSKSLDDDGDELGLPVPEKPLVTPLTVEEVDEEDVDEEEEVTPTETKKKAVEEEKDDLWDRHEKSVRLLAITTIGISKSQPRRSFDGVEMRELADSIAQHGILQPLVVRRLKKDYELVAGERRLRAAKSLGWDKVPCVVRRGVHAGASSLELALIENIQRQDLNPVEEAMAYRQLSEEYGMTHEEIGRRVGRSRVGITNAIRVLQLPDEVQRGVSDGAISFGHAKAILMIPDQENQVRPYRHMVAEGLTVRKAETRARRIQRTMDLDEPMREKRKGRSAFEIKYSGKLEDHYGFDARVKFLDQKNRFEVLFRCFSMEEIEELLGRLLGTRSLPEKVDKDVIESEEA